MAFSPPASIYVRIALVAAVMGVAGVVAGRNSQSPFVISPLTLCSPATRAEVPEEVPYLTENDVAMSTMMTDMVIKPTGDVDRDFVSMITSHHQGAIDMARVVLRNGHNEQIRHLAQEVIVTQQQEIAAMRLAVGEALPPPAAVSHACGSGPCGAGAVEIGKRSHPGAARS